MTTKQTLFALLTVSVMLFLSGCKQTNTYSKLLQKEKKIISDFIAREEINVVDEMPSVWGEKDYYAVPEFDNFYIHIVEQDTNAPVIEEGNIVLMRYKKYGLTAYSDTTRYWNTDDGGNPIRFQYGNFSDEYYCAGWTAAVKVAKYSGTHCRIICPSKMGFTEDNTSVIPYGYELLFKVKNF